MAELAEWSAQVLRCQGSDVPVKVVYIQSRKVTETSDSLYGWPKECPESGKQISHHASGVSEEEATTREPFNQYYHWRKDLGKISPQASPLSDIFSGQLFEPDPVEILDPKNYIWQRKELFEDIKSALEAFLSKFKNRSRVVPFDPEAKYGPKSSYAKPRFIEPSEEDDDLLLHLLMCAINEKRLKQSKHVDKGKEEEEKGEEKKRKEDSRKQKGGDGGELKRKIEAIEEKEKKTGRRDKRETISKAQEIG